MFEPMLEADPSFDGKWQEFCDEYSHVPEQPYYLALSELAMHLVDRIQSGDVANMAEVFNVVERWHVEGDRYVREAASIGLLEGIQNLLGGNGRNRTPNSVNAHIEQWLGPESLKWWVKLDRFWDGDKTALQYDD